MLYRDLTIVIFCAIALTACGANKGGATGASGSFVRATSTGTPSTSTGASGGSASSSSTIQTSAPLEFGIDGVGNHARHLCIPAVKKLVLRMKPIANYDPLLPANPYLLNAKDNMPLYDGSPAIYTKLRVRMSIPGTSAAWDFVANVDGFSPMGDFSSYLRAVPATNIPQTAQLSTPEYGTDKTVYGSNPYDGTCTYWEAQTGRCSQVSSVLRVSEGAACPAGQQKILITMIATDYPCQADRVGWCQGGSMQIVPDYQHWMMTVQAVTENTRGF